VHPFKFHTVAASHPNREMVVVEVVMEDMLLVMMAPLMMVLI
jgi:hypothetical protein